MKTTLMATTCSMLAAAMFTAATGHAYSIPAKTAAVDDSAWQSGPSRDWFVNWDKALAEAKKSGKAMFLLNTGSDWCGWCKRLKANVLEKPEFIEFARRHLVLVYLDSPSKNPLPKDQKAHNRLIAKSLPFGGGVPNALVMSPDGDKLGSVGGGGDTAEEYVRKLRKILDEKKIDNSSRLFREGYAPLAAEVAAHRASLPSVAKRDFKARLTGVAVVDPSKRYGSKKGIEFLPPETKLDVPSGKTALFRVEYDFPEGYSARVWVRNVQPRGRRKTTGYFGSNPSGMYKGSGVAYGFLSRHENDEAYTLDKVAVRTNSDPELDDYPQGWEICEASVNLRFLPKQQ